MAPTATRSPEERARTRARYLTGFLWHLGTFVIINAFFWLLDFGVGASGLQWAYWITAVWGFALAFHALAYLVAGRQLEERKTRQYLHDEHGPEQWPWAEDDASASGEEVVSGDSGSAP